MAHRAADMILTAEQVLDIHGQLTTRLRYPAWHLTRYMQEHVVGAQRAYAGAGGMEALRHMFWPLVNRDETRPAADLGARLARQLGGDLFACETVQVTTVMLDAMIASAPNTEAPTRMDQADVPFPAAIAWLDRAWSIPDGEEGEPFPVRAVSWRIISVHTDSGWWPAARVAFWTWIDDDIAALRYVAADRTEIVAKLGPVHLVHTSLVGLNSTFDLAYETPTQRMSSSAAMVMLRLLWMWLGMEITDTGHADLPRHAMRRAARHLSGKPAVRVITLRKVRHATDPEGTHRDVDWSCQWPVRGHHRHLDSYEGRRHHAAPDADMRAACGECGARITWVRPYIKGPDGQPLKVSRTIYRLAR